MLRRLALPFFAALALVGLLSAPASAAAVGNDRHVVANLQSVNGSNVNGIVVLNQLPQSGTDITLVAFHLASNTQYVSLYYDNHQCNLEPYSPDDVIGAQYQAHGGVGFTHGRADDDLDEINSVSVRRASDFTLLACANVHP